MNLPQKGIALFLRKNLLILSLIIIMIILGCVLNDLNESTITQCYDNSKNTFITVSIIEAAVDILEGVRIAGVDLGNVLHPVLDCLKILWKFLLVAMVFFKILLMIINHPIVIFIISIGLLGLAIIIGFFNKAIQRFLISGSFIFSTFPILIIITGLIINPLISKANKANNEFEDLKKEYFALDTIEKEIEDIDTSNLTETADNSNSVIEEQQKKGRLEKIKDSFVEKKDKAIETGKAIVEKGKTAVHTVKDLTAKGKKIFHDREKIIGILMQNTGIYIVFIISSILVPIILFILSLIVCKLILFEKSNQLIMLQPSTKKVTINLE